LGERDQDQGESDPHFGLLRNAYVTFAAGRVMELAR
jgi:hypothetical protein